MADNKRYFVDFREHFAVLWMNNVENRFDISTVKELHNAIDKIESNKDVKFLVVTGKGKFFSNGLNLDKIIQYNKQDMKTFLDGLNSLFLRMTTFPVPTVAAINGHAYAGGALFALCHDYRIMRTKKGWFCLPEINLQLRFSPLMMAIAKSKILDPRVRTDAVILGRRYTAEQAIQAKLVDEICDDSQLLETAIELGRSVVGHENWNRKHMTNLKRDLYCELFEVREQNELESREKFQRTSSKL